MIARWRIEKNVRGYLALLLLLETGVLGAFLALDFFLFYVFYEVMLLPMYFLIGVWGGGRRKYAAIKFVLYTLLGSVFILVAMIGLYFTDVRDFVDKTTVDDRADGASKEQHPTARPGTSARAVPHVRHPGPAAGRAGGHARAERARRPDRSRRWRPRRRTTGRGQGRTASAAA